MSELELLRRRLSSGSHLLLFGAKWSPPSLMLNKLVQNPNLPDVEFLFIDVETDGLYADYFNVVTIPTVLTIVNGRELDRKTGAISLSEITSMARVALNYSNRND